MHTTKSVHQRTPIHPTIFLTLNFQVAGLQELASAPQFEKLEKFVLKCSLYDNVKIQCKSFVIFSYDMFCNFVK